MERQLSVDFFRGATIAFMIIVNNPGNWGHVFPPLLHAPWHGCTPTDLVFPSFLFIVGVSMWLSFERYGQEYSPALAGKILKRSGMLILIGLLLTWFPFYNKNIEVLRIPGVLQRIGLCYGLAAFLCISLSPRNLIIACAGILLGYWALLYYGGVPGQDPYSLEFNAVRTLDRFLFTDQHLYKGEGMPFDPEGLLSTFPAVVTVVLGWFSGRIMNRNSSYKPWQVIILAPLGLLLIGAGLLWNEWFPLNKKIWTSSYVLYAGGWAMLLLALAIWLLDIKKWRKGTQFFLVFGANPLFAFVLSGLLVKVLLNIKPMVNGEPGNAYKWLYVNAFQPIEPWKFGSLLFALSFVAVIWACCKPLYDRKIYIKI